VFLSVCEWVKWFAVWSFTVDDRRCVSPSSGYEHLLDEAVTDYFVVILAHLVEFLAAELQRIE
jgi:hypothetical protein